MDDANPLVSIVIPAYNHAAYLEEAVRSVLAQDYPRVELLVIDDGSTDDTGKVLQRLGGDFFRETQPNMGQAGTLNRGWQMARGTILGYLSADDALRPGAVMAAVDALAAHPAAVATYCDFELMDPGSRTVRTVTAPAFDRTRLVSELECAPGPGAFFRRAAWERAGPWNPRLRQMPDYDFWLRLALHGPFVKIGQTLARFRVHEASQTFAQTSEARADEPVRIIEAFFARADLPDPVRALRQRATAMAHLTSAQLHARAGRWRTAFERLRAARAADHSGLASVNSLRLLANAFFNRTGHRLLWALRRIVDPRRP